MSRLLSEFCTYSSGTVGTGEPVDCIEYRRGLIVHKHMYILGVSLTECRHSPYKHGAWKVKLVIEVSASS